MKIVEFKINLPLKDKKVGDIIKLKCDDNNMPYDIYWQRRLIDAKIDNCIEILTKPEVKKLKNKESD